mgnify:CR=1 FL=1
MNPSVLKSGTVLRHLVIPNLVAKTTRAVYIKVQNGAIGAFDLLPVRLDRVNMDILKSFLDQISPEHFISRHQHHLRRAMLHRTTPRKTLSKPMHLWGGWEIVD